MKRLVLALVFLLAASAAYADKISDAADSAVAAVKAGDGAALETLAEDRSPDPWLVADELCRRKAFDVAAAFAKAGSGALIAKLPDWVAAQRDHPRKTAADDALAKGRAALSARDYAAAIEAVKGVTADAGDLTSTRAVSLRALALRNLRRVEESERAYTEAADAAEKIGWIARSLESLHRAASSAFRRGAFAKSIELLERETKGVRALGDERKVATLLSSTGLVLIELAEYDRAARILDESAALARKIDEPGALSSALNHQGIMYRRQGRFREALAAYERSLEAAEAAKNEAFTASALGNIGLVRASLGEPATALDAFRRSLAIYEKRNRPDDIARTLGNIGVALKNLGDYDGALEAQEKALAIYRETGHRRGMVRTLGNLGVLHGRRGDLTKALEVQGEALRLSRLYKLRNSVLGALVNLGVLHKNGAEYAKALECYDEALVLAKTLGIRSDEAGILLNRGLVHQSRGDLSEAIRSMEDALDVYREVEEVQGIASCLTNIASVHREVGDRPRSLACLEEALRLCVKQKDRSGEAAVLNSLGAGHASGGDYAKSFETHRRLLAIRTDLGERNKVAEAHAALGSDCAGLGRREEALAHYRKMLSIAEETGARQLQYQAHQNLGDAYLALARDVEARRSFERGLEMATEAGSQVQQARGLGGLARVALAEGRYEDAIRLTDRGLAFLNLLVTGLADEHGAHVRGSHASLFEVGVCAGLATESTPDVFRFLEAGRAGVLLQSLGGRDRLRAAVLPPKLIEEEAKARSAESVALWRFQRALDNGKLPELKARRKALDAARARVKAAIERIQREARTQAALLYPEPIGLSEVQAALRPGEVLVSYGILRDRSIATVLTRKDARVVRLAPPARIQGALFDASRSSTDLSAPIAALGKLLFEPLKLPAGAKRILVSPDGALTYVPFALLAPGKEVTYVPSAATWTLLSKEREKRGEGVLALADPKRTGGRLAKLPQARLEAKAIGDVILIGEDATEARLKMEIASRTRWRAIHLACHGFVDPESPARAWLALATDGRESGDLTCFGVYRMSIPADLVTVSACETAKGKIYRAEGVVGFTRAFLFAGAPRVLVSLWKVDDEATKILMTKFYELWRPGEISAAAALRAAQQHVAAQERFRHPSWWAAWQLWGVPD